MTQNRFPKDYVVFDLETTGLSPERDQIIEISAIRVQDCKAAAEFATLVNPGRPIPPEASRINGITDEMVHTAPVLREALEAFWDFAGEDILVGHNIHNFDMKFLSAGTRRTLDRNVASNYVDTLFLARTLLPLAKFRLTDVASYFHLSTQGAHRALNDCRMNQQCYEEMRKLWEAKSAEGNVSQNAALCPKCGSPLILRRGKFGEFWGCSGFPQCRFTRNA